MIRVDKRAVNRPIENDVFRENLKENLQRITGVNYESLEKGTGDVEKV